MKLVVVLDGERYAVDVDPARSVVRVGAHEWPYRLVASEGASVTFELLGERIEVRDEPAGADAPERSVVVNGELHSLRVESVAGSSGPGTPGAGPRPTSSMSGREPAASSSGGPGRPMFPPMPGKVLEVLVRDGDRVRAGQVLLVLEAMKMRNEVTSPVAGEVAGLRVTAGANVSARDLLLRVVPV
ncbi:MAG: biotin/lipoyl-binding protein [Thermoplasmata archaeon]|nr:biotin/lipoyl-binding protein [Thermoplasmata archaeon]